MTETAAEHGISPHLPPEGPRKGLAFCMSGGGDRAALFHLGALCRMNELGILSKIDTFTSVSGGSIMAASPATRSRASRRVWRSPCAGSQRRTLARARPSPA
jgi:predicted acylesterase/phospholipase RssA